MTKKTGNSAMQVAAFFEYTTDGDRFQKPGLTQNLVSAVPAIARASGATGGASAAAAAAAVPSYKYPHKISPSVVASYFKLVSSRLKGEALDIPQLAELTPAEWNDLFWLAFHLDDADFYKSEYSVGRFPLLADVHDQVLEMPEPARLHYLGAYIGNCFDVDCDCDRRRVELLQQEAKDWFDALGPDERAKYEATPLSGNFRLFKNQATHTFDRDEKDKDEWRQTNAADLEAGKIYDWYDLDLEIQVHLVHLADRVIKLPNCRCGKTFDEAYTAFCTTHPKIGEFLWENMKRDELMKNVKIDSADSRKANAARHKGTFDELKKYLEHSRRRQ